MLTPPVPGLDVGALLDRVEGIAPIEAVAEALAEMLDARELTFLIADFSGRAVVRLTTGAAGAEGARLQAGAQAETLTLSGTVYERVLRTQEVDVQALGDGARVIDPVTERGDAIGLLELVLPAYPGPTSVADVGRRRRRRRSCAGLRRHRCSPLHRRVRVGTAHHTVLPGRRGPASTAAGLLHL